MKKFLIMLSVATIWIVGFYGFYMPKFLEKNKPEIEEFLNLHDLKPIKLIDTNGWKSTTKWEVEKSDSVFTVTVQMRKGNYVLNTRKYMNK